MTTSTRHYSLTPAVQEHFDELLARIPLLETCADDFLDIYNRLRLCFAAGGKLLLCGNGGSAADCEHIAGELLKGYLKKRPLPLDSSLPAPLPAQLQGSLPAISLTGFPGLATAFANDCDSDYTFAQLVHGLGRPGDILLAISTSGNSPNVLHAVNTAQASGMEVIALTGGTGGRLRALAHASLTAPASRVDRIQELHICLYHTLCAMLEETFFPDA